MRIETILQFLSTESIEFSFTGDPNDQVEGFSSLSRYREGTFTWVKKQENVPQDLDASCVALAVVSQDVSFDAKNTIHCSQSKRAFFGLIEHFYGQDEDRPSIGEHTYLSPKVKLGKDVRIGHNCTLDGDITIGDHTVIWNNVTLINRITIGADCEIRSGAVIGHDGFGYTEDDEHRKTMIRHFGGVQIGDSVTIGENACISRGTIDDTVIERGVKIDALAHVAHNCWIEENTAIPVSCGVCGSVHIGRNSYVAGSYIRNQCTLGDGALVGLGAVVMKDVGAGKSVAGNPAREYMPLKP